METSLHDIADSFEVSEQIIRICLQKDQTLIESWTRTDDDTIYFHPKGVDGIESILSDYTNKRFTFNEIAKGLDMPVDDLFYMINANEISLKTLRKSSKSHADYSIKGEELSKIINESEKKKMPIKKRNRKKNTPDASAEPVTTENTAPVDTDVESIDTPADYKEENADTTSTETTNTETDVETNTTPADAAKPINADATEEKPKTPRKSRKTKTTNPNPMTEEMIQDILDEISSSASDKAASNIRKFMLESNEMTIENLAICDDKKVKDLFNEKYIILEVTNRIIIVKKKSFKNILGDATIYA